ncbi:hypothetical protein JY97_16230 [Alkalispirochaeta odontotermitis]|nr:hypothetical protein JY97_16230 [Alkalispirochaeta odontotermitis]CAB1071347.1 Transcriptional regulator [Olavius algarvensis Delta 1 endosymbiont]
MQTVSFDYGDGLLDIDLPDSAAVVEYGKTYVDPEGIDPYEATRNALANPHGFAPLKELGGPDKKIVIGFPDRVKGGVGPNAHRRVSIPIILEALLKGGTKLENIKLVCCMGLHRKNTLKEWYWYLGKEIVDQFYPGRLINHDGEASDLLNFNNDDMGNAIQCNKLFAEADLAIVIGHCAGNPYGGYSGGYKMIVTGLSGAASIASHHCPKTMHRPDWLGSGVGQHMRTQFESIGRAMEAGIGKKFFGVDAVLNQHSEILAVEAGELSQLQDKCWPVADKRTNVYLDMPEPADVLIMGVPRNFHYGPGMGTNPILMSLAIGGQMSRCWNAFRPGGVVIATSVCDGWFNDFWFPSYEKTYEALQKYNNAAEFLESDEAAAIGREYEYLFSYSNFYTYHPFHAMSMITGGAVPNLYASSVYVVGATQPQYARGMGFKPVGTMADALKDAERYVGKNPRILCTPRCFTSGVAVNLHLK